MTSKPLYDDPVVAEIRLIRERMLAECGGKPDEFFRRLREGERLQAAAGREFIDGPVAKHVNPGLAGTVEPE
jgi:hypothetical protein